MADFYQDTKRTERLKKDFERIPLEKITPEEYEQLYSTAQSVSPLKDLMSEREKIEELIARRDEYKPDQMPNALMAIAQAFAPQAGISEKAIDTVGGAVSSKQKNELQKLAEMIQARKEKADLAQAEGSLAAKGVDQQLVEPKYLQTGQQGTSTVFVQGDKPMANKEPKVDKKAEEAKLAKEIAKQKISKIIPWLSKKNIPGVGEAEGFMPSGVAAFFQKKQNKEGVNILRNQINDLGYNAARANDPSGRLSDADVKVSGQKFGVGKGESEDRVIQGTIDILDSMIITYPEDKELVDLRNSVLEAKDIRSGKKKKHMSSGLSKQEQDELDALEKKYGGKK